MTRRSSVFDQRGPRATDPVLQRRTAPLQRRIVDESLRNRVAEHDQALQHHREIDIRDRPVAEEIVRAIRSVRNGHLAFPRRIAERLSSDRMTAGLSHRERQVLELVAKGLTNKEVANTLQISQFTVRNHLNHITEKLEVSDRTEAIFIAIQTGIITV